MIERAIKELAPNDEARGADNSQCYLNQLGITLNLAAGAVISFPDIIDVSGQVGRAMAIVLGALPGSPDAPRAVPQLELPKSTECYAKNKIAGTKNGCARRQWFFGAERDKCSREYGGDAQCVSSTQSDKEVQYCHCMPGFYADVSDRCLPCSMNSMSVSPAMKGLSPLLKEVTSWCAKPLQVTYNRLSSASRNLIRYHTRHTGHILALKWSGKSTTQDEFSGTIRLQYEQDSAGARESYYRCKVSTKGEATENGVLIASHNRERVMQVTDARAGSDKKMKCMALCNDEAGCSAFDINDAADQKYVQPLFVSDVQWKRDR
eukprot:TRINITY_DN196_c0_g1_i2.p1 TRINITY_DN196_c0_g1~~TRINITY_DN196_c0_g1_i2.p1  ORF type:complete len:320 (-),score=29.45 TRINITY_DN196_c0_g1_i2:299-1258(-)